MPKGKTMWRKENQSGNEMINFCEVFGLHDYRILISEKWIQLRLANVLENGNCICWNMQNKIVRQIKEWCFF